MTDQKKVVVVTGGSGGIGSAISRELAAQGFKVAITFFQNERPARELAQFITESGGDAIALPYDMADYEQAPKLIDRVVDEWGQLDALVANAVQWPMLSAQDRMFANANFDTWTQAVSINAFGTAALIQPAARHMQEQNYGRIVIVSTEIATEGMAGGSAYGAAKAMIHGLVANLRWEVGPSDILINLVSPGFNMTPKNLERFPDAVRGQMAGRAPTKRLSTPEDVAPTVAFLASNANRHMTGEFISVSGGAY